MEEKRNYSRIYLAEILFSSAKILLQEDHLHYLANVVKLKNTQVLKVFNENCGEYFAQFMYDKKSAYLIINNFIRKAKVANYLHLGIAIVKNHIMSQIINQAVQLGVTDITPIITKYTNHQDFNLQRNKKIAIEALEQSNRCEAVTIHKPRELELFVAQNFDLVIFADERQKHRNMLSIATNKHLPAKIAAIVGPEGGFSQEEAKMLSQKAASISLGDNILTSQTACACLLSQILLLRDTGNF